MRHGGRSIQFDTDGGSRQAERGNTPMRQAIEDGDVNQFEEPIMEGIPQEQSTEPKERPKRNKKRPAKLYDYVTDDAEF